MGVLTAPVLPHPIGSPKGFIPLSRTVLGNLPEPHNRNEAKVLVPIAVRRHRSGAHPSLEVLQIAQ